MALIVICPEGWEPCYGSCYTHRINNFMLDHMLHLTESALAGKTLKGSTIALLSQAFINDSDAAQKTLAGAFFEGDARGGGGGCRARPLGGPRPTSTECAAGLSRGLAGVLAGADAAVVFTGHKEYRGLEPERVKGL
jgi:UDP-N-acetyl-D-mannosaminuronic acid dehydrogenase